jgi:ABC-2 type transport system ATP-binding protein
MQTQETFDDPRLHLNHGQDLRASVSLTIRQVSKTYSEGVRALDNVSLSVQPGMFGLLGPNGAGKSTLMRTIATLQRPDSGAITFGDIDVLAHPAQVRRLLGYLPQEFGLYPNLSAEMILDHFANLKGIANTKVRSELVHALLQKTNLLEHRKRKVGSFSGGMKQRLGIAIALAGSPRLLIVDEPTAGLDPTERYRLLDLLAEIASNVVVILSTHIVEDVRELCGRMAIISRGRVVCEGRPTTLLTEIQGRIWGRSVEREELSSYRSRHQVISSRLVEGMPVLHIYSESDPGDGFVSIRPALEDLYFYKLAGDARPTE